MELTIQQIQAKCIYLAEENAQLRDALLDAKLQLGVIALDNQEPEAHSGETSEETNND